LREILRETERQESGNGKRSNQFKRKIERHQKNKIKRAIGRREIKREREIERDRVIETRERDREGSRDRDSSRERSEEERDGLEKYQTKR
jgi:hypothetical protein